MDYRTIERILPEWLLTSLKERGKTDKEIAESYHISLADVLLLRGWYGIKPVHIKPEKLPPDPNRKPRVKRPILGVLRDLHKRNHLEFAKIFKWNRNEEIYNQYKLGYGIKKLAKMYFVTEQYLKGFIARKSREEKVQASQEYQQAKEKPLTRDILMKYKAEGKADIDIGLLHNLPASKVFTLRKKYRIKGASTYHRTLITNKMRAMILEEYRQGKPINEICKKHGIHRLRISSFFSQYLAPQDKILRRAIVQGYEGQKTELLRLQQFHKTDAAIAKSLGITRQRVHQMRVKHGIPPLSPIIKRKTEKNRR